MEWSGRLPTVFCAAVMLEVMLAASATAGTVSYQDGVFRYRDEPGYRGEVHVHTVRPAKADGTPGRLSGFATSPLSTGPGCHRVRDEETGENFACVLTARGLPRHRLSLGDRADRASFNTPSRGVIYGGPGADYLSGTAAGRVYGGSGNDELDGARAYGGAGDDEMVGIFCRQRERCLLRGGSGDDTLNARPGPTWAYGGPGDDELYPSRRRDMLVAGPGRDVIEFLVRGDKSADTFRIRGGGHDTVFCEKLSDRRDVYFADRTDELDLCGAARIAFAAPPRIFR